MAAKKKSQGEQVADETEAKAEDIAAEAEDALNDRATEAPVDRPSGERSHPPE